MSTTTFPPSEQDTLLVEHGQPTRQQMHDEMVGAGVELACDEAVLGSVAGQMYYVTMHYAGAEIRYGAIGGYPIARAYTDFKAIREVIADGVTLRCDRTSAHAFRVRLRKPGEGRKATYSDHTTSTSGYPVRRAVEKYRHWKERQS